nr:hypothetical protein [Methylosinus sp. KRF6]
MSADHEISCASQRSPNASQRIALPLKLEIGEDQIAAENQIENSVWNIRPDVLQTESDRATKFTTNAIFTIVS